MCGIIGTVGEENSKQILIDALRRLEYRGYDSSGIAILNGSKVEIFRAEGKLSALEKKIEGMPLSGHLGIGHTRWATHGAPTENNAHPHQVGHVTLVHNGIIENFVELRTKVEKSGRTLRTETDSEVIAHLLDAEVSKGIAVENAIAHVAKELSGSYSLVILCDLNPNVFFGIRHGVPLIVGAGRNANYIVSDVQGILHKTKTFFFPNDDEIILCSQKDVRFFDLNLKTITHSPVEINWNADELDKAGYDHYMLKEIFEQPQAISNTLEDRVDFASGIVSIPELKLHGETLKKIRRIYLTACGTALHSALIGKFYFEKIAGIPCEVEYASEFRYRNPLIGPEDLVLAISQSGETADTLGALREAKSRGSSTIGICNVRNSTLSREVDLCLFTNAGPEIGVASTKAFTTQLCALYQMAVQIGFLRGFLPTETAKQLTADLLKLPHFIEQALGQHKEICQIVDEVKSKSIFFYVGRNSLYPIALEGALKLKEISYLHAEGYPSGELKHGPIAIIDKDVVCFVLMPLVGSPNEKMLFEKTLSNLNEIKARRGIVIEIACQKDESKMGSFFINVPVSNWALHPILSAIPIQLFAYEMAKQKDVDIDKPRNLAKSVTVE